MNAELAREQAFEAGIRQAGALLQAELSKAELKREHYPRECERMGDAARKRYGDAQQRAGDAYRAAIASEGCSPEFAYLSLYYVHVPDVTGENWAYPHTTSEMFTAMAAYQARVIELSAAPNVRLEMTFIHRS